MNYPNSRLRRLRYNQNVRRLVEDIDLKTSDLIYPIFVCEGENIKRKLHPFQDNIDTLLTNY